jgi:hypothetical protein
MDTSSPLGRDLDLRKQAIARAGAMRGKRVTAGQRAHALPMQEPGQERLGRADARRPEREPAGSRDGRPHPSNSGSGACPVRGHRDKPMNLRREPGQ